MKRKDTSDVVYVGASTLGHFVIFYFKDIASKDSRETLCVPADTIADAYQKLLIGDYYIKEER